MFEMILFDLDATLLPMDQNEFVKEYFKHLARKLAPHGYEAGALVDAVWKGTAAMIRNDGSRSNEDAFWSEFANILGEDALADKPLFDEFYMNEVENARGVCGFNPAAAGTVRALKAAGFRVALATNPIFPAAATEKRIRWAGLEPDDFELRTTYENSAFCKPNPAYYTDIARSLSVKPSDCLMVGNDATEDMAAQEAGMSVFLITDCLINRENKVISVYPNGSFEQLMEYVQKNN
ncbi:MAG: HAD family hydrolase [Oscillospiraceae bacterium]|nr:HAD family hydrolase [Oscillospiraceae bacterium]